ncbi:GNAT family N-acetyltransferase [Lacticaseibacillus daqingensis]|uniref:GNAT family N-acetyltransferase n=1 Tax=Lacticaseibacillus daqingensis TaxID=2486014 RepID=UPI000F7BA90F|nr:GNAT family N-acetyltransferase [Lacticaseibacillus daqingensis]
MQIEMTTVLTDAQKRAVAALSARVHAHDGTFKQIYLSNQLNAVPTMGTFFMTYADAALVGFLMNYADGPADEAAELSVIVDPTYRRQGLATALIAAARAELARFGYRQATFVTERAFLQANPTFLTQTGLTADPDSEFQMSCPRPPATEYVLPAPYDLRLMVAADLPTLVQQQVAAFRDTDVAATTRYLQAGLADPNIRQYVLVDAAGAILGSSAVDTTDQYYFFGLFIVATARGRGYGTMMVRAMIEALRQLQPRPMQLAVASDNPVAHHVYLKVGFREETEVIYLDAPKPAGLTIETHDCW